MTPREKVAVRTVWSAFCKEHPDYGVLLFNVYFLKYPDNIKLFKQFKGKSLRTLSSTDPEFSAHCSLVGEEITSMIEALDDVPRVLEILEKTLSSTIAYVSDARALHQLGQVVIDVLTPTTKTS
ncbi:globin-like [Rhipicephalus sanguineus]|uniref:globin-like n=1 Tax=Rhipicephalus sanguineus TaxID=34632 RepID=UPI0018937E53|nr:globin-like [Rhipicephalus sanguineus]